MAKQIHNSEVNNLLGKLLVAAPYLKGEPFEHSVVYLHTMDDQSITGTILNRPTEFSLGGLSPNAPIRSELLNDRVYHGGPVELRQLTFAIIAPGDQEGENKLIPFVSAEDAYDATLHQLEIRPFIGQSVWGHDQILHELAEGVWYVTPPSTRAFAQGETKEVWCDVMRHISPIHDLLSYAPADPTLN